MPEEQLLADIRALATRLGWLCYHTHDSRRSQAGYPDLTLTNGRRVIFAELKTATGKPTQEQATWLALLRHAGQECYLWRPADWPEVVRVLSQGEGENDVS